MRNQGRSVNLKRPGYLIPVWIKQSRIDSLTPDRLTPARCRFTAAAADHGWKTRPDFSGCKARVSASIARPDRVPDHCCLAPSHPVFSLLLLLDRAICRDGSLSVRHVIGMRRSQWYCSNLSALIQVLEGSKCANHSRPIIRVENFCVTRRSFADSGCSLRKSVGSAPRHYSASRR